MKDVYEVITCLEAGSYYGELNLGAYLDNNV